MEPGTENYDRLYESVGRSYEKMEAFRRNRLETLKQFVGTHFSDNGPSDKVPVNFIQLYVLIYLRMLVANNPKASITTRFRDLKAIAADMETWMTFQFAEMRIADTLRMCAQDALISGTGVVAVGISRREEAWGGTTRTVDDPYCDFIDQEDFVIDMTSKRPDQVDFIGHRYRMPLSDARNDPTFDEERRAQLTAAYPTSFNAPGDERSAGLSGDGVKFEHDEARDYVELWQLFLPREQLLITCEYSQGRGCIHGKPLRIVPWVGPKNGPYHLLSFLPIPGSVLALAPVAGIRDMHDAINIMSRKLVRQSERQKTVGVFRGISEADAERIRNASDGELVRADMADAVQEVRYGGPDAPMIAWLIQFMNIASRQAGNLDVIGGLAAQAETLGQEELLASQSSNQLKDMQDRMVAFARQVIGSEGLAYYFWNDPEAIYEAERFIPGVDFGVTAQVTPEQRSGNFLRLNFDIAPYSLQAQTPQQRSAKLNKLMVEIILPALPMLQAQGINADFQQFLRLIAKYEDIPDLDSILVFMQPVGEPQPQGEAPRMAGQTTRTYQRVNRSSQTAPGLAQVAMQAMQGLNAETAA